MKLTKKHIGQLFDNRGSDGSWAYILVDVKGGDLLFIVAGDTRRFEIDTNRYGDWRPFKPVLPTKAVIKEAWLTARKSR